MHIINNVRVVGNDQQPVTFDVSGACHFSEVEHFYRFIIPRFKRVRLIIPNNSKNVFPATEINEDR
jgi:hypothetical protein